jgi:hypothetical protein
MIVEPEQESSTSMIRVGLPLPLLARLRQQWKRLRNQFLRHTYLVRNWFTGRREERLNLSRARALEREARAFHAFSTAYQDLIDVVCMAAREEAPALYQTRYAQKQRLYRQCYQSFSHHLQPYCREWGLEEDPFKNLCQGELAEVIHSATGIEVMMTMNGILEACHCHYDNRA